MIPDEAVEAAAAWLPHSDDCEVRPERDCTCWQPRVDIMRGALEAAAPHLMAAALRKAATDLTESAQVIAVRSHDAGLDNEGVIHAMNTDAGWLNLQADNYAQGVAL